ncbi:beta-ketoacyl synthase domain-containing protein [Colletotrichum salicis]|uniref:Beta-ketoacyl synthase domain-containing protein n=1 Tax=Colletotrichum salicis TaxID=1209931 RepID=A0A135UZY5_9PEZI|nr:beta-ketoacyl synthase domain-containing protein [Colletotrichum salicis]
MVNSQKTILFFGDQTDPWVDGIDYIMKQAGLAPWLQCFMTDLCTKIKSELKNVESTITESLGEFSSIYELAEKYRHAVDETGVANAILIYTMRAAMLLQCIKREPDLLRKSDEGPEWLGISGGLMSLSPLAAAKDFDTLYAGCLEAAGLLCRICRFCYIRSRATEDRSGTWGWAVLQISTEDLRSALEQFQTNLGIPTARRAQVGVTGDRWASIVGPPSVLEQFLNECPAVSGLPRNKLNIRSLQHAIPMTPADLDYVVGDATLVTSPLDSQHRVWGTDDPSATYETFGDLLRTAVSQSVSRPLDIVEVVTGMNKHLGSCRQVDIKVIGTSSHTSYLAAALKQPGRTITVQHEIGANQRTQQDIPSDRIAIVGMAGRGPGSDDLDEFWNVLMTGKDLHQEIPPDRFDLDEFFAAEHSHDGVKCTTAARFGCFMKKPGEFDARFFRISPREAMFMDPGHRQFLMSSYEALETAGYSDGKTRDINPNRIGVFYGQSNDDWNAMAHHLKGCDAYTLQGAQRAFGAGRLAFQMNWEGPTYSLDSACASTLSSIHLACMSLLSHDIDMAVSGAANVVGYPHSWTSLSKSGILSNTGNCKPFREDADGYCRADFVGSVVLKRLDDAVAHNDNILAVIGGSGRNHSGNSPSITTSDAGAQERLYRQVLRRSGVLPDEISYVEMHGTGTQIGDPAEIGAVSNVFKGRRNDSLVVGSIKANIGHSEAAAGMSSLLKCVLMLQRGTIPPQAGMPQKLNPKFPSLEASRIEILSEAKEFKSEGNKTRRLMLNNFDAAGGNACLLIEDYKTMGPIDEGVQAPWSNHIVVTSAKTQASLQSNKRKLLQYLQANPNARIQDVAYTTTARRSHHQLRSTYVASSTLELISKLRSDIGTQSDVMKNKLSTSKPIVFIFTGQGSHYGGMGSELYKTSHVFREVVDHCVKICADYGFPLFLDLITERDVDASMKLSIQTQLAVLTLEIALAALWRSEAGIEPSMVMGHSLGEYAALHVAGVLSLTDVLYLVGKRAELLSDLCEAGACTMLAVAASSEVTQSYIDARQDGFCFISCSNSPRTTVVGGMLDDIEQLAADMAEFRPKLLPVPYAFHSFQMDPILDQFVTLAQGVTFSSPKIPVASTLLATVVDASGTFDANYMGQQTRQKVQFADTIMIAKEHLGDVAWVELGPSQVCGSFVQATLGSSISSGSIMSTLDKSADNWTSFSKCLAKLYDQGLDIDWLRLYRPYSSSVQLLTLPTYAWDLQDFWITYTEKGDGARGSLAASTQLSPKHISTCAQSIVTESSTNTMSEATFRALIADPGLDALIEGHRIRDMAICPGSAFCDAASTAAKHVFEAIGTMRDMKQPALTIRNLSLQRPLRKRANGSTEKLVTTANVKKLSSDQATVSFQSSELNLGSCTVFICEADVIKAGWDKTSFFIQARMDEVIKSAKEGRGHRIQPEIFYALFSSTVRYSPSFRCIKGAYVSDDFQEAAAEIVLGSDPIGTCFTSSPYHGESLVHLAGFLLNANPSRPRAADTTFMMDNFESVELPDSGALVPGKSYLTLARVSRRTEDAATCDVWVFDSDSSEMVMQCSGLRFHEVSNTVLDRLLGKTRVSVAAPNDSQFPMTTSVAAVKSAQPSAKKHAYSRSDASEVTKVEEALGSRVSTDSGVFASILENISKETGTDSNQLTDDTATADIGVDSIMAIEITAAVKKQTGLDLPVSTLMDYPTIGDLRKAFGGAIGPTETIHSSSSSQAATSPPSISEEEMSDESLSTSCPTPEIPSHWVLLDQKHVGKPVVTSVSIPESESLLPVQSIPTPVVKKQETISPPPKARVILLHGRPKPDQTPLYMIADGTGTIASYIHLPPFNTKTAIYGVDSPFIRCPEQMNAEVGIEGAAKLIVDAVTESRPHGTLYIGGFSGGGMLGYEVCRQLGDLGRQVDGLLIIDICSPRTKTETSLVKVQPEAGWQMFQKMAAQDTFWNSTAASAPMQHLRGIFKAVAAYHPEPMTPHQRPKKTSIVWAEKGMGGRCEGKPELQREMVSMGFPAEAYPGFMEDPALGALAWGFPDKRGSEGALGPNGWDKYVGPVGQCLSVDADHLEMPMPGHVHLMREKIEEALAYFQESS